MFAFRFQFEHGINFFLSHIVNRFVSPFWIVIFGDQQTCDSIQKVLIYNEILSQNEISSEDVFPLQIL